MLIERLVAELGLERGRPAPGALFHWAASTQDGTPAVIVYESREAADNLVGETIGPLVGGLGRSDARHQRVRGPQSAAVIVCGHSRTLKRPDSIATRTASATAAGAR